MGVSSWSLWNGTAEVPLILQGVWNGTAVVPLRVEGDSGGAPANVDARTFYWEGTSHPIPVPSGARKLVMAAWNTTASISPPAGWTLLEEMVTTSGRAALWTATSPSSGNWTTAAGGKLTAICLGYSGSTVHASEALPESTADTVHTAPAITVSEVPATVVRFWWDKVTGTTSVTGPGDHTELARHLPLTTAGCSVLAAELTVETPGTVPAADATFNMAAGNAGGFSVALVA